MTCDRSPKSREDFTVDLLPFEEVKKRARTPQSSGLTSSLADIARSSSLPSSTNKPKVTECSHRREFGGSSSNLVEESTVLDTVAEEVEEVSPNSRPILRRPRTGDDTAKAEVSTAESPTFEWHFQPPHMFSLPTFQGTNMSDKLNPGSLYVGVGRKLRGFDAERFRRSVMQQTGFLETAQS